jgi:tetratricopeptide (TPR) repeat protein
MIPGGPWTRWEHLLVAAKYPTLIWYPISTKNNSSGDLTMRLVFLSFIVFVFVTNSAHSQNDPTPWLSIATPATVKFAEEYSAYLQLPPHYRADFRLLAENEMGPCDLLFEEMEKFNHRRRNPALYHGAGRLNLSQKYVGFNNALVALEKVTSMDPSFVAGWAKKGELALSAGALQEARESLEAGLLVIEHMIAAGDDVDGEEHLEIHRHLGWTLRELGYNEEGLVHMQRALGIKSNDHELLLVKGLLLAGAGRTSEAINLAVKLPAEEYPDFSNQKSGLAMTRSGYASDWIKSQALLVDGDVQGAMHLLRDVSPYRRFLPYASQYWNDLGLVAELAGHENAALYYGISFATQELKLFCPIMPLPSGTQVLDYPDDELPILATFGSNFYAGGSRLGFVSFQMNMMAGGVFPQQRELAAGRALEALDIAERRNILPLVCQAFRGRIYHVQERFADATVALNLARDGFAAKGEVDDRTSYLLGLMAMNEDRDAEAQAFLEEAVQKKPDVVLYYRSLGLALAKQGKTREAEVVLERAVVMDSYSVPGLFNLGLLYCKLRRFEEAVQVLEQAYALDNQNREVQHLLHLAASSSHDQGKTLHSSNQPTEANGDETVAYVGIIMSELGDIFAVIDSTSASPGTDTILPAARSLYENNPSTFNRKVLALACMDGGKFGEVQELLGPLWGSGLDPDEVVILLYADRKQGQKERAQSLGRAMLKGEAGTDNPFIRVMALVSLSGEEQAGGEYALAHLAANPVLGVGTGSGGDPNDYWSEFMRSGFSNYRAAVHSGYGGPDYLDPLPDSWLRSVQENESRNVK